MPSAEVSNVSEIWLKLTDVPENLDKKLLQVDLYVWTGDGWSKERWATSDRPIFGEGRLWHHSLSLIAPRESSRGRQISQLNELPAGKWLLKVYFDQAERLTKHSSASLGPEEKN